MRQVIENANILTPDGFMSGHSLIMSDHKIEVICKNEDISGAIDRRYDAQGKMLWPGLIDLQVNGGGGYLFNDAPRVETIEKIGAAHRKFGTTGFLPTLISDDPDVMIAAIDAVEDAITQGVPGVLGIHLEGPHLNPSRKGVHDSSKFTLIGDAEAALLARLSRGKILVTLAPERTTPEQIRGLTEAGVIVSLGHSAADYEQAKAAINSGLTGFTHLFNAMTPLASRAPGIIAAALEDARTYCGIIVDGHHVHPAMLRLAHRAKQDGQMFLVTDAMPSVGADDKDFVLGDLDITVSGGKCLTKDGTLAGSDLDMVSAVRNAHLMMELPLERAIEMASLIPAKFMGLENMLGSLSPGKRADMILVDKNFNVVESWIGGEALN